MGSSAALSIAWRSCCGTAIRGHAAGMKAGRSRGRDLAHRHWNRRHAGIQPEMQPSTFSRVWINVVSSSETGGLRKHTMVQGLSVSWRFHGRGARQTAHCRAYEAHSFGILVTEETGFPAASTNAKGLVRPPGEPAHWQIPSPGCHINFQIYGGDIAPQHRPRVPCAIRAWP